MKPTILVAPLDWGLGHATRCIPIIREMVIRGYEVEIAGSGKAGLLLLQEFPSLIYHEIPGYGISYPRHGKFFMLKMLLQLPWILFAIQKEHKWLQEKQRTQKWDIIISDNRYGFWLQGKKTIILTHQLRIKSGWGDSVDSIIQRFHYKLID